MEQGRGRARELVVRLVRQRLRRARRERVRPGEAMRERRDAGGRAGARRRNRANRASPAPGRACASTRYPARTRGMDGGGAGRRRGDGGRDGSGFTRAAAQKATTANERKKMGPGGGEVVAPAGDAEHVARGGRGRGGRARVARDAPSSREEGAEQTVARAGTSGGRGGWSPRKVLCPSGPARSDFFSSPGRILSRGNPDEMLRSGPSAFSRVPVTCASVMR